MFCLLDADGRFGDLKFFVPRIFGPMGEGDDDESAQTWSPSLSLPFVHMTWLACSMGSLSIFSVQWTIFPSVYLETPISSMKRNYTEYPWTTIECGGLAPLSGSPRPERNRPS